MASNQLIQFDLKFQTHLIGVDEVGRGALAGPVYASAAHFTDLQDLDFDWIDKVDDSKKLSAKQREELSAELKKVCIYATASASVKEINKLGILPATFLAMKRAIEKVVKSPELKEKDFLVLVDGNHPIKGLEFKQKSIIKGDGLSLHIAAASIIAKTQRDTFMKELGRNYHSDFQWDRNAGYGTESHRKAIIAKGTTQEHRTLFIRKVMQNSKQLNFMD